MLKISKSEVKNWILNNNKLVLIDIVQELDDYTYSDDFADLVYYENNNDFFKDNFDDYIELLQTIEYNTGDYCVSDDYVKYDGDLNSYSENEYVDFLVDKIDIIIDELIKCRDYIEEEIPWGLYDVLKLDDDDDKIVVVE